MASSAAVIGATMYGISPNLFGEKSYKIPRQLSLFESSLFLFITRGKNASYLLVA
jgi:hypothetical protein